MCRILAISGLRLNWAKWALWNAPRPRIGMWVISTHVHVCIIVYANLCACMCASGVCHLIAGRYLGENSKPVITSGNMTYIDKVSSDGLGLVLSISEGGKSSPTSTKLA